jgi:gluconate:H+ symporter, GntP family
MSFFASSLSASPYWPFAVLTACVLFVIVGISVLRLHPFLALIGAALLAGVMSASLPPDVKDLEKGKWLRAVELVTEGFGRTAGDISIVIGMATLIGLSMMNSGAADKVVRRFLSVFGEKRAAVAVLVSTYVLSIPIFFDTMFMLMAPLAMALTLRTKGNFTLFVLAVCIAGVTTHSMTVPHPGPNAMVASLRVDLGASLYAGILVGALAVGLSWPIIRRVAARTSVPLRETPHTPISSLHAALDKPESALPGFMSSIMPVVLPIILISMASFWTVAIKDAANGKAWASFANSEGFRQAGYAVEFIGNKNIALIIGTALALWLMVKQTRISGAQLSEKMGPPLETAGVIILITAAGGAFGYMLRNAGVGEAIRMATAGSGINLLFLGWLVALILRIAQGSATVAMLTTAAMMEPLLGDLTVNRMYLFLAVGFGAFACSWMNDSGFWVVSRLSGFTEKETLRTWTVSLTIVSVIGLLITLGLAAVWPAL